MARLIFERALKLSPLDPEDPEGPRTTVSYWPTRWPLPLLAKELAGMGSAYFAASYQNDPSALEGNALKASWITWYEESELINARMAAGVVRGSVHVGIDPTAGGTGPDPDFCAMVAGERINNTAYLLDCNMVRLPIEDQAQAMENWMDIWLPSFCVVEDTSARGYVYTALSSQINDGKGSKYPFAIEKPQGGNAQGSKLTRFLSMAARFENSQIRVPGVKTTNGWEPTKRFEQWFDQWRSFPSGHDDSLDATFWCQFSMFKIPGAVIATKDSAEVVNSPNMTVAEREAAIQERMIKGWPKDIRGRPVPPIGTPFGRRQSFRLNHQQYSDPFGD